MNSNTLIGLDQRGDSLYAVRVLQSAGRPEVHSMQSVPLNHFMDILTIDHDRAVLAVPDDTVQVKLLRLNEDHLSDMVDRARFEMMQSLLEDESEFLFDLLTAEEHQHQIGLIYRRQQLKEISKRFDLGSGKEAALMIRALALGRGFVAYAREVPGDLVALADFNGHLVSICFIYHRQIVGLTHMPVGQQSFSSAETLHRSAAELRTVVNFYLATLANLGISVPLSELLLSGPDIDHEVCDTFKSHFPAGVGKPELNMGYLRDAIPDQKTNSNCYLVALGLVVN